MLATRIAMAWGLGAIVLLGTAYAQTPGEGGVRNPLLDPPAGAASGLPTSPASPGSSVEKLFNLNPSANPLTEVDNAIASKGHADSLLARMMPLDTSILKPAEITPQAGKYCISVISYTGREAPRMAYDFVRELRERYKLPAYAFTYGTEEKRKEYEKAKGLLEKQIKFLAENNLTAFNQKIYVRTIRLDESCAVLLGGYASEEIARSDLNRIRALPTPDPKRVALDRLFYGTNEDEREPGKFREGLETYANPFKKSFVVRNPMVKHENVAKKNDWDVDLLRKLNAYEPYSLLKNPKAYTLAIKQFQTPHSLVGREWTKDWGPRDWIGLGNRPPAPKGDDAAENAHRMAEGLRKIKLDAYVLHTKFASIVTVGGYESLADPSMQSMSERLEKNLKLEILSLFPKPLPLAVPR